VRAPQNLAIISLIPLAMTVVTNMSLGIGASKTSNPSINTDWRDKAAPAGYVRRWVEELATFLRMAKIGREKPQEILK